jgi:hypothetical protein
VTVVDKIAVCSALLVFGTVMITAAVKFVKTGILPMTPTGGVLEGWLTTITIASVSGGIIALLIEGFFVICKQLALYNPVVYLFLLLLIFTIATIAIASHFREKEKFINRLTGK